MATKKINSTSSLPIDPGSLPDDGTPVSFTQTFAKNVGLGRTEEERIPTAEDYEDEEWEIRRQTPEGWEFVEKVEGMPLDNELREDYGAGKYELTPVDPRTGKTIQKLRKVRLISSTISPAASVLPFPGSMGQMREEPMYSPPMSLPSGDEVPAWMRWQMQQAAEERAEQRRRAEEALSRQKEFEEKLALREFERQEREERERKRRDDLAADEARRRDERFSQMLTAGIGLAQAFFTTSKSQPQHRDVNEVLLKELMEERRNRSPANNSMRDNLDLLLVLDKLAQSRAEMATGGRSSRDDDDDSDDTMKQLLVGMLPAILNRGGGGGAPPQLPDQMVDQMIEQAFHSPQVIEKIAMKNPQGIASAFLLAVKKNPALERAVLSALESAGGDEED